MKSEIVDAAVVSIQAAELQGLKDGLNSVFDAGVAEAGSVPSGGFTQADIDAAVAKAVSDAQALDAQALADAQAKAALDVAALQVALDAMTAKEQLEEVAVADVQKSILSVQAAFDAIKALLVPAPVV